MATSMSLDDLVVLNDEIASLVRAGVPLDLGLSSWGRDLSGPLRQVTRRLEQSVAAGRDLGDALSDPSLNIPPAYRAVVIAGLRSGRLPSALESLSENARNVQHLRGTIALALIYPLLLVTIAYTLFLFLLTVVLPTFVAVYEPGPPAYLAALARAGQWALVGIPLPPTDWRLPVLFLPPVLLWLVVLAWWHQSRRAMVLDAGSASRLLGWIPLAARTARRARGASLAEIFALLIDHNVPLADAVRLAATCTSDRDTARAAGELADEIERGQQPAREKLEAAGLPAVVALLVTTGARQQTLVTLTHQTAEHERLRALRDVQWLRDWLPLWLILVLGSTIGVIYCLTFFVPFTELMGAFARPLDRSMRIGR